MSRVPEIRVRRVYDEPEPGDGYRVLVDRLWPRGLRKEAARLDEWNKGVAPSNGLRKWVHGDMGDPARWREFERRYAAELDGAEGAWRPLLERAGTGPVTLLYAAKDEERNHALVLRSYLLGAG
jgi:uncharacterized protein YeaO (DUF488 family)